MPSNTSAATATVVSTPFSDSADPGDAGGGVANDLWYRIDAAAADRIFGYYTWTDYATFPTNGYYPNPYLYSGDNPGVLVADGFLGFGLNDLQPVQFIALAGETYWIKIKDDGNWDPGDVMTITIVQTQTTGYVPAGSVFIPSDKENTVNVLMDPVTGDVLRAVSGIPPGETGAVLPSGMMILENSLDHQLEIYTSQLVHVTSVARPSMGNILSHTPLSHDGTDFYAVGYTSNIGPNTLTTRVSQISPAGSILNTWSFTLTNSDVITSIAVTRDGTQIIYLTRALATQGVMRYDLFNDTPLSDFIAPGFYGAGPSTKETFVLDDGSLLIGFLLTSSTSVVRHFDTSATLLMTYDTDNLLDHFHPGLTDATFVAWVQNRPTNNIGYVVTLFLTYRVSDGVLLSTSNDAQTFFSGMGWAGFQLTPPYPEQPFGYVGNESSCPLLITRVAIGEAPPTLGVLGPIAWMEWKRAVP